MNKLLKSGIALIVAAFVLDYLRLGFFSPFLLFAGLILIVIGVLARLGSGAGSFGEGFAYAQKAGNTGIAVSPERRLVKLKQGGRTREYDFKDVRGWRSNLQVGGTTAFGGMTGVIHNIGAQAQNKQLSGFFVSVRDIDNPEWRIKLFNRKSQARWMEILDQTINEGSP